MQHLTVSQLCNYIKAVIDEQTILSNIMVLGEVVDCKVSGRHTYFSISDGECTLQCARFGQPLSLDVGGKYVVYGSVKYFAKTSKINFTVISAKRYGEGELSASLQLLKAQLESEGLLGRKRSLPRITARIALVTSPTGAVVHDFYNVISRLAPSVAVVVVPTRVQGDGAESDIAGAISLAGKIEDIDVVVVARGGGSSADLACYNTEVVARALARCPYPTVSAIGHESDILLTDFVADERAGTPSIAAEMIVRPMTLIKEKITELAMRMRSATTNKYTRLEQRARLAALSMISGSDKRILECSNKVERLSALMAHRIDNIYTKSEARLEQLAAVLNKSNPLGLISSGYAKISRDGIGIGNAGELSAGDNIDIFMQGGVVEANVKNIKK